MTTKQVDYNRASLARKRERGLVRVEVWVPEKDKARLKEYAQGLRDADDGSASGERASS